MYTVFMAYSKSWIIYYIADEGEGRYISFISFFLLTRKKLKRSISKFATAHLVEQRNVYSEFMEFCGGVFVPR